MTVKDLISYGKAKAQTPQMPLEAPSASGATIPVAATVQLDPKQILATLQGEIAANQTEAEAPKSKRLRSLADFPAVIPEKDNLNILIKGRWLERGGSAFLVSTAGTGKSIWSIQFALSMMVAREFSGLNAWRPFKCWVVQSEDSDDRVSIDRDDIVEGLKNQCDIEAAETGVRKNYDWDAAVSGTIFADFTGLTGAEFLKALEEELAMTKTADLPDVIILNPLLDFLGGDMCSQEVASAFLSGGKLNGTHTKGLRAILKRYAVGALIVHHTGKPPSENELKGWIKSAMPEYQAAGSSYITNWGRSFITMMKVPGMSNAVMLTAGKNGGGLKWEIIGGAQRRFLVWSDAPSVAGDGSRRHFWAEPSEGEKMAILSNLGLQSAEADKAAKDALTLAEFLHDHPMTATDLCLGRIPELDMSQRRIKAAYKIIADNPTSYGLTAEKDHDKGPMWFRPIQVEPKKPQTFTQIETDFL